MPTELLLTIHCATVPLCHSYRGHTLTCNTIFMQTVTFLSTSTGVVTIQINTCLCTIIQLLRYTLIHIYNNTSPFAEFGALTVIKI